MIAQLHRVLGLGGITKAKFVIYAAPLCLGAFSNLHASHCLALWIGNDYWIAAGQRTAHDRDFEGTKVRTTVFLVKKSNQCFGESISVAHSSMRITSFRFGLALAFLIVMVFHEVIAGSASFFYRDFGLFGYPLAHYHRTSIWNGELPLWNPYSNAGLPFLAQWNTMVFYPLSVIYLVFPLPWSLNAFCLFHLWLAGMTMFCLARYWTRHEWAAAIAAVGYAFCGLLQHSLMWPNNIAALALMPLVVLAVEQAISSGGRRIAWASVIASTQFLAGAPEVFLFTWVIIGCLWLYRLRGMWGMRSSTPSLWRKSLSRAFCIGFSVTGLTALQWIPLAELVMYSHRDSGFSTGVWSMPVWGLANFLVPMFHCTPSLAGVYSQDAQQWTSSYYVSIGLLWLALCGVGKWKETPIVPVLVALSIVSLILAFGDAGFVYPLLKANFPFLGFVRYPIKFVIVVNWCLPLLAAYGAASLWTHSQNSKRFMYMWAVGLALLIVSLLLIVRHSPFPAEQWPVTWKNGIVRLCLLVSVIFTAFLLRYLKNHFWQSFACGLGILFVAVDGLTHTPNPNPTVNARSMKIESLSKSPSLALGEGRAMLSPRMKTFLANAGNPNAEAVVSGHRDMLYPNWNLVSRVPMVNGFYSLYIREAHHVWSLLYADQESYPKGLADFLGVKWISSKDELFSWDVRRDVRPLISIGVRPEFVDEQVCLERLARNDVDLSQVVLLPKEHEIRTASITNLEAKIIKADWSTHSLDIEYVAQERSWLVIAQSYNPNWKAFMSGKRLPVLRANHAFQAIEVPGGHHEITLLYKDNGFTLGVIISGISLLALLFSFLRKMNHP